MSLRLAHLADPHLGFRQYARQTSGGINQREADVANAFRAAVDGVLAARPDVVIVAGDLFHAVRPTNASIVFAFHQFQRLRAALPDAPIILIAGNHDTPRSSETGSILRLYEEAGVDVATDEARRLAYPALDLSVLAVPHAALVAPERPVLRPDGPERHQVLVLHGEVEGVFPADRSSAEYGGAPLTADGFHASEWGYVAIGHYHVRHQVAERAWYAGALEYVSSNPWGELLDEARHGVQGKGWLLADLDTGHVVPQPVDAVRRVIDLPVVNADGLTPAEIDAALAARLAAVPGGHADQVLRQVVLNIPRHVARDIDHAAVRQVKAQALHYQLDLRRPESARVTATGAPVRRQTLPELLQDFLERRPLPAELDRERFVATGLECLSAADDDLAGAEG